MSRQRSRLSPPTSVPHVISVLANYTYASDVQYLYSLQLTLGSISKSAERIFRNNLTLSIYSFVSTSRPFHEHALSFGFVIIIWRISRPMTTTTKKAFPTPSLTRDWSMNHPSLCLPRRRSHWRMSIQKRRKHWRRN